MLKILERKIALQLLVFYGLFVIPLLLGGAELYFFQRDALQQSAQQADLGLAQAIAQDVGTHIQGTAALKQLNSHLVSIQQQLSSNGEVRIWVLDMHGTLIASAKGDAPGGNLLHHIPGLHNALLGTSGHLIAQDQQRDWLYSYVPVSGTGWTVIVGRPGDVTFATVISFQHSLIIALLMLLAGASVFWFVMHGWVVAPLSRLAQAATRIKPDQDVKVTDSRLLRREKSRQDEIGRLVNAFSTMEDDIHTLFRKSDERSYTRLQTLDAIMSSMDEGVLLEDSEGEIIYANQRFTRFVGILSRDTLPESPQGHHLEERLEAILESSESYHMALRHAECGEKEQVIEFRATGHYNQLGQFIPGRRDIRMRLFQVRDMTGQVIGRGKIYNDVTRQNEAEQIKKNLLAIASHELRTPLTAIKGYATSLLETDIELDAFTQRDFLQRIVQEEDRMAELVTSLLEMSQLEAGTLKMAPSNCRLDTLIARAIEAAKVARERISLSLPAEIPQLYVDRRRIEMVLRNLLENAQKYAGHSGNQAEIEVLARYANNQEDEGLYISIVDNGSGLPAELTERIFDSFYQIDGGRERSSSGVGLGLAICRGFIEAHGGRIWAENRTGDCSGAIFHIWLPARLLHTMHAVPNHFDLEKAL